MKKSDKPLFSKPVLAGLMIFISLMVLVLNLTAPPSKYPEAHIEYWQTDKQIPITWVYQNTWQGTNKLELRIRFNHGRKDDSKLGLTDAVFSLLMLDTLPLSTSSINQRLSDVTTQLTYHVSNEESELAITLNSEPNFLSASMEILIPWFNNPDFKNRTFHNWQQGHIPYYLSNKAQLEQKLFPQANNLPLDGVLDEYSLTLQDIQQHYQTLLGQIDKITLAGNINGVQEMQTYLAQLTKNAAYSETPAPMNIAPRIGLQTQVGPQLLQSHGAFAFNQVNNAKEWISLQLWLPYYLSQLKQASAPSYVQLHFESSPQQKWAWWSIQHEQSPLLDASKPEAKYRQDEYFSRSVLDESITSFNQNAFEQSLTRYQEKLANYTQSPSWWARMASQETLALEEQEGLTVGQWNETYGEAVKDLSFKEFNANIRRLIMTSSLQELQQRQ